MTTKLDPKLKAILCKAVEKIRTRGWIQEAETSSDGVCAIGAIKLSTRSRYLQEACAAALGFADLYTIPDWNDASGRRKTEVIGRFCQTIKRPLPANAERANEILRTKGKSLDDEGPGESYPF